MSRLFQWIAVVGTTIVAFVPPWMKEQCPRERAFRILSAKALAYDGTLYQAGPLHVFIVESGFRLEFPTCNGDPSSDVLHVTTTDPLHPGVAFKVKMAMRRFELRTA